MASFDLGCLADWTVPSRADLRRTAWVFEEVPLVHAQEREQERRLEHEQVRPQEVERTPPVESKTREETGRRDDAKHDESRGREQQEKQPRVEGRGTHPEQERALADEFESGQRHRIISGNMSGKTRAN